MPTTARLILLIGGLVCAMGVHAADRAGVVTDVNGLARANNPDEPERDLREGDTVYVADNIATGRTGSIKIKFNDGSRFDLGPRARMRVENFNTGEGGGEPAMTTRVLRGAFRFLSGLIAKRRPQAVRVNLNVATIGIRGTHVGGEVTETSAQIVLLDPETAGPTAVEVFNEYGSVTIDEPGFGTDIPDQFSAPTPVRRMQMRTINNLMRSMQNIQRVRPRM